jgi:hypothetical protein
MGDLSRFEWRIDHENRIAFVMIDGSGSEVTGLDGALTIQISKNGGAFAPAGGTQAEIGLGWYTYLSTVAEADTVGPVAVVVTGAGAIQQNLEYVTTNRVQNTKSYEYPVTRSDTLLPVADANVDIYTDVALSNRIWSGVTDEFGHPRDEFSALPVLQIGETYQFVTKKVGLSFPNPDAETIA